MNAKSLPPIESPRKCIEWQCARTFKKHLISDGWFSPDTYSNEFKPFINGSAVYLFLLHETEFYDVAIVAYVGMSINLEQRMSGHNIIPLIHQDGYWPMRWFKPTPESELRKVEADLIAEIDPPWNIQGRTRGVPLL